MKKDNTKKKSPEPTKKKKVFGGVLPPAKPKKFVIPPPILNQLNEVVNGGYYLIAFSDQGFPAVLHKADNPVFARALTDFCVDYFRSVGDCREELMMKSIMHQLSSAEMNPPETDDDDDEDEIGVIN